jgi:NADP-dependent 3-hydroxy acid dehydrogenase YdfG
MTVTTKPSAAIIAGCAVLQVARHIVRTNRKVDWRYKRVIFTGGSREFGLVISRQLVDHVARLTICSRDESDLEVAAAELRQRGGEVLAVSCDIL